MIRLLLALACAAVLAAQQPAEEPKPAQEASPAEAPAQAPGETPAETAAAMAPAVERNVQWIFDTGYRFVPDVGGNFQTYRSVVNLGEGPKLFGLEFNAFDPKSRVFDRLTASANNWGGDPYNTARVDAEKRRVWRLGAAYRNIAYFNFLPSFANPAFGQLASQPGAPELPFINQRSFDLRRRMANVELELLPGRAVTPYFAYSRDSGRGSGITPFVANANEYPVATRIEDGTHYYRGGVRVELRRAHLTLEQGAASFRDDQSVFNAGQVFGNRTTTLQDRQLFLTDLSQIYRVRGDNLFSRALLTAAPADWANLYGQFHFSQPDTDVRYTDEARGLFFLGATRFFNGLGSLESAEAKMPRTSASLGAELRPHRRLRVVEAWMTDRYHNASSALLAERLLFAAGPEQLQTVFSADRLTLNYNRQQLDLFFDVTPRFTLRGGHRYTWGDAVLRAPELSQSGPRESGRLRMHAGIAGAQIRPFTNLTVNLDYEGSPGDANYFRTSLQNYHLGKARTRWQPRTDLFFSASLQYLDNRNPAAGVDYEFHNRSASAAVQWMPQGGRRASVLAEYTRSALRSDIFYLAPLGLTPERSLYRDNGHTATTAVDLNVPGMRRAPQLTLGGSLFRSSGSRPTRYYMPFGRFSMPLRPAVSGYAEWRWYGFTQPFFLFETFRSHQFQIGFRLSM